MADAEVCAALTEELCALDNDSMFAVVKDALLANLEVGAQIVEFLTEFMDELPAEESEANPPGLAQAGGKSGGKHKGAGGKTAAAKKAPPPMPDGGHCWGIVSAKDAKTGTTIVNCSDSGYGPKALIPRSVAEPATLTEGTVVAFLAAAGNGPAPVAISPVWALSGRLHEGAPLPAGEFVGQVTSIHNNGTVFIDCPAAKEAHGRDPAAHATVAAQCGLEVGTILAFGCVASGSSGKVWMSAPCWKNCSSDVRELPEPFVCANADNVPADWPAISAMSAMAPAGKGGKGGKWEKGGMPQQISSEELRLCVVTAKQGNGCALECADFPGPVWLDAAICEIWNLDVNDVVGARLCGMVGACEVIAPVFKRMGHGHADMEGFGPYFGEIGALKGDIAFVPSEQAKAEYGRDAAVHASILQQCGLEGGEVIAFGVKANASGKIWVSAPCWKCCSNDVASLNDFVARFAAQGGAPGAAVQVFQSAGKSKGGAQKGAASNGKGKTKAKADYGFDSFDGFDEPPAKVMKGAAKGAGKLGPWW